MNKKYPKLKFFNSKRQELDTYLAFLEDGKYRDVSREMNWAFYGPHPDLKVLKNKSLTLQKRKYILKKYINNFYTKNFNEIRKTIKREKENWQKFEKTFYDLVDNIFKNHKWPKGKYIAYPTIWGIFPRFLDNKTFQFPLKHQKKNYIQVVIAHEMLHFIFYDYVYKKYPKLKSHKYDFDLWGISEIFNVVIQNSPKWIKIFEQKTEPYPEHKKLIPEYRKIWNKSGNDIDVFLSRIFKKYLKGRFL